MREARLLNTLHDLQRMEKDIGRLAEVEEEEKAPARDAFEDSIEEDVAEGVRAKERRLRKLKEDREDL